jgi:7,8-dihydropterin-6-yl-methyl-4-(beta-D-ribofuranosyl)aminobenzene 5'-phosphate synthase
MAKAIDSVEIDIVVDGSLAVGDRVFLGEGGFSAFVTVSYDDESHFRFLFDTGAGTPALEHNIGKMKLDLSTLDMIVLSHGHFDHVGGLMKALSMAGKKIPVICHPKALDSKIFIADNGQRIDAGIHSYFSKSQLEEATEVITTSESFKVADGILTTGEVPRKNEFEQLTGPLLKIVNRENGRETLDQIMDDLSVIFQLKDNSILVLAGCCHAGIVNTIEQAIQLTGSKSIVGILGGLHLFDASKERLEKTIEYLKKFPIQTLAPCHCSGLKGRAALMYAFPDQFKNIGVSSKLNFEANP